MTLDALIVTRDREPGHQGWPRVRVPRTGWRAIGEALRTGRVSLLGLWGDAESVHAALYEAAAQSVAIATNLVREGSCPSLAPYHPPALRPERAIRDLYGTQFTEHPDPRPWLDHGHWPVVNPLAPQVQLPAPLAAYEFLAAEGPALHQVAVGPVHAGIIEPGHFRFTAHGETVVRLEERLGYAHKGIEALLAGRTPAAAAPIAARVSGDSTVAYSWAFARAVETALAITVPARAMLLRGIMAALERLANHLGDVGAICNDAAFSILFAEFGILREEALRASAVAFGHRLMMDRVVPGGVSVDLMEEGINAIGSLLRNVHRRLPELIEVYDNTASLQDRTVGTGHVSAELVATYAAGGYVGRASGRAFDARVCLPYAPYDVVRPELCVRQEGDVDARVRVRLAEIGQSLQLIDSLLRNLPVDGLRVAVEPRTDLVMGAVTEATAVVEGFRGDVLVYVRIGADLAIQRCHLRDPSWFQWPLLEAAVKDNIVADFPLCNKSFNCSYSGHDL